METKYVGTRTREGCTVKKVEEGKEPEALDPRLDLWNHSPSGLEWGYRGSGPAQTALAILADATGNDRLAVALHQDFKFRCVGRFPDDGFALTAEEVQRWAEEAASRLDLSDWEDATDEPERAPLLRLDLLDHQAAEVYVRGYGTKPSTPGHGAPILIEPDPATGELFLYVWADINQEDYTHKISLAGAHERQRQCQEGQEEEDGG